MAAVEVAPDPEVVELLLPPRPEVVSMARLVVGAVVAADPAFDEERSADVRLAVSEACTNAVEAQQAADPTEAILLRCAIADGVVSLTVSDHGGGFDPDALAPHPDVGDPARLEHESGLGIPLIRLLSDAVDFAVTKVGTTITMTFEPRPATTQTISQGR